MEVIWIWSTTPFWFWVRGVKVACHLFVKMPHPRSLHVDPEITASLQLWSAILQSQSIIGI